MRDTEQLLHELIDAVPGRLSAALPWGLHFAVVAVDDRDARPDGRPDGYVVANTSPAVLRELAALLINYADKLDAEARLTRH